MNTIFKSLYKIFSFFACLAVFSCVKQTEDAGTCPSQVAFRAAIAEAAETRGAERSLSFRPSGTVLDSMVIEAEPFTDLPATRGTLLTSVPFSFDVCQKDDDFTFPAIYNDRLDLYYTEPSALYSQLGSSGTLYCWYSDTGSGERFEPGLDGNAVTFRYEPASDSGIRDSRSQNDILFATADGITPDRTTPLDITFSHVMSAFRISISDTFPLPELNDGDEMSVSCTLNNVYLAGVYDPESGTWTVDTGYGTGSVNLTGDFGLVYDGSSSIINNGEYTALLVPQTLPENAWLMIDVKVNGSGVKTYRADIVGTLVPGHVYHAVMRDRPDYFWFEAKEAGSVIKRGGTTGSNLYSPVLYWSTDRKHWTLWDYSDITLESVGDRVYFYGTSSQLGVSLTKYFIFECSGVLKVGGDASTLIAPQKTIGWKFGFLFMGNTAIVDAGSLYGLDESVNDNDCRQMFMNCTNLATAPRLVPRSVAYGCFSGMFSGCTSLSDVSGIDISGPVKMARDCYSSMFMNCRSLTTALSMSPLELRSGCFQSMYSGCRAMTDISGIDISAPTTMYPSCYCSMFAGCTSITSAPAFAPEVLASTCFQRMFQNCTSLCDISGVDLSAPKKMNSSCYYEMFSGCSSIIVAPAFAPETLAVDCFYGMFNGCTALSDISGIDLSVPTKMFSQCYMNMFSSCRSIVSAPSFSPENSVRNCFRAMFSGCTSLSDVSGIDLAGLTEMSPNCCYSMFYNCTNLTAASPMAPTVLAEGCCYSMYYNCSKLTDFSGISLPATTLEKDCYRSMFYGCKLLTSAPPMSPTVVAPGCCEDMFVSCTALSDISGISLPAGRLFKGSYKRMFYACSSLTAAPPMAPTVVMESSCAYMFTQCTSLTDLNALTLPATELNKSCYEQMFSGCTNLTAGPDLPALELQESCYQRMFYGCPKLEYVNAMFLTEPGTDYTDSWLHGVKATGTFIKNASATWDVSGIHGIPSGWTVTTN